MCYFRFYNGSTSSYEELWLGTRDSYCFRPCLSTKVCFTTPIATIIFGDQISGRLIHTFNTDADNLMLGLSIHKKVTTTESYIPHFSFAMFIADLGGSLGLWLGVGVVQLLGSVHHFYVWIKSNKGF